MALKELISNQTIRIDDHQRGNKDQKNWDDIRKDVHIDKFTNTKIDGKRRELRIKIPINSDRPIEVTNKGQQIGEIPKKIDREIKKALENKETRDAFVSDILTTLKDFPTSMSSEQRAKDILDRLSKHFGLEWTKEKTATYARGVLMYYAQIYTDKNGLGYFLTIDRKRIEIGQNNGYARYFKKLPRK